MRRKGLFSIAIPLVLVCIALFVAALAVAGDRDAIPFVRLIMPGCEQEHYFPFDDLWLSEALIQAYQQELSYLLGTQALFEVPINERPPLNPVITDHIDVQMSAGEFTIYKLHYESLPDFHVVANLYVPDPDDFPWPRPAVICTHGHWFESSAKASREVQVRSIGLALKGYVVLAYDAMGSGERKDPDFMEGHEDLSAAQAFVGGPLSMGIQAYEVSRAVDYLMTRTGPGDIADMDHFAVTGASGGASQIIFATALDHRIDVIVPVCFNTGENLAFGCTCEHVPRLGSNVGRDVLLTLVYPSKVCYLRENDTWAVYLAENTYLQNGRFDYFRFIWDAQQEHGYSVFFRERMYAWLSRWLLGNGEAGETEEDPPGVSDQMTIRSFEELTVGLPAGSSFLDVCHQLRQHLPEWIMPSTPQQWSAQSEAIRTGVKGLMQWPPATDPVDTEPGDPFDNPEQIRILPEELTLEFFIDDQIYNWESWFDAALYKPLVAGPWPAVVILNPVEYPNGDPGYEAVYDPIDESTARDALLAGGYAVLVASLRFNTIPDEFPSSYSHQEYETAAEKTMNYDGLPLFGRRAYDTGILVSFLRNRADILEDRISVWGMGEGGPIAIASGALDQRICQVIGDRSPVTFAVVTNDRHPAWSYPSKILDWADLPHLAAAIAPKNLVFANANDDARAALSLAQVEVAMDWAVQGYTALGAPESIALMIGAGEGDVMQALDPVCGPEGNTAIELISFEAQGVEDSVVLNWETASEPDNAGFHLWRADEEAGQYLRITPSLIPARGDAIHGARYEFTDPDVEAGERYWYKLEDVDIHGRFAFHGPVSATVPPDPVFCGLVSADASGADLAVLTLLICFILLMRLLFALKRTAD